MTATESPRTGFYLWTLLILLVCLIPWAAMEHGKAISQDVFWMAAGVARLLHGATMTGEVYDPNPPLSFIAYIPLYLFSRSTGVSYATAAMLTTLLYIGFAAAAVFALVRRLAGRDEAFIASLSFILAGTVLSTAEFGQRDQLMVLSLLPFVLGQIILTRRISCPRGLLRVVFIIGAVLVLLKPHYGLLPAAFLIHRAIVQKRWPVIRDADFVALAVAAISYIFVVWFFFRDFAVVILPDILTLYLGAGSNMIVFAYAALFTIIYLTTWLLYRLTDREEGERKKLMESLFICALLCLIPYIIQMKDFKYHLIPSLTFFWTAAGIFVFTAARRILPPHLAAIAPIIFLCAAGYASEASSYSSGGQMASLPLTRLVKDCGGCRFMVFSTGMPPTMMTSYYAGAENASRFPSLWFVPKLRQRKAAPDHAEYDRLFHKYAGYLAEDLKRGRPALAVYCPQDFDYIKYFSDDQNFAGAWKAYRAAGHVDINFGVYYPDLPQAAFPTYNCDVYRRNR